MTEPREITRSALMVEVGRQFISYPISKIFLLRVTREVVQRQHGD